MDDQFNNTSLSEAHRQLLERDEADSKISNTNKQDLIAKGLVQIPPKRVINIDTGSVVGISNVVDEIVKALRDNEKIIAIDGLSGVGKSSTAKALREELSALSFSFGEVFRLLCYLEMVRGEKNHQNNLEQSAYVLTENSLDLHYQDVDVAHHLSKHINNPDFSCLVPEVAANNQALVIEFMAKEIEKVANQCNQKIILEGRDFTLDFLPCDLRVKLRADSIIRAKRRLSQSFD
ncbi:MAG: Cytidylate kinase [bacterium ADurb.Bin212]|nr:MAG: Cytidylate kinase [bacterium ADurb.Bin212]